MNPIETFFAGPLFFVIAITLIFVGVSLLSVTFRQGWVIVAVGQLAMGLAIPGWLTVVGIVGCIHSVVTYFVWTRKAVGRSL